MWLRNAKLRLYGIDTPELRGSESEKQAGRAARDYLRSLIDGKDVIIKTYRDRRGKYGRYLAEIFIQDEENKWININQNLVAEGFAEERFY